MGSFLGLGVLIASVWWVSTTDYDAEVRRTYGPGYRARDRRSTSRGFSGLPRKRRRRRR